MPGVQLNPSTIASFTAFWPVGSDCSFTHNSRYNGKIWTASGCRSNGAKKHLMQKWSTKGCRRQTQKRTLIFHPPIALYSVMYLDGSVNLIGLVGDISLLVVVPSYLG